MLLQLPGAQSWESSLPVVLHRSSQAIQTLQSRGRTRSFSLFAKFNSITLPVNQRFLAFERQKKCSPVKELHFVPQSEIFKIGAVRKTIHNPFPQCLNMAGNGDLTPPIIKFTPNPASPTSIWRVLMEDSTPRMVFLSPRRIVTKLHESCNMNDLHKNSGNRVREVGFAEILRKAVAFEDIA